jgi:GntR family transcriptional regulator
VNRGGRRGNGAVPAWVRIEELLMERIESGAPPVGERLPSERELAEDFGVSRMTVRQALGALEARGLIERGVGRGTFVRAVKVDHDLTRVAGFSELVERQGLVPGARLITVEDTVPPGAVAAALELQEGQLAVRVRRVRLGSGVPLGLEDSWLPSSRFPDLHRHDLAGSLYTLMREKYGLEPAQATERFEPVLARPHEARALDIQTGAPLMLIERTAATDDGVPVEYARDRYRGDRARFTIQVAARALADA